MLPRVFLALASACLAQLSTPSLVHAQIAPVRASAQAASQVVRAAVIDDDDRRTEWQFSAETGIPLDRVQRTFAATGTLRCGGISVSAQLTLRADIITTVAHAFDHTRTCRRIARPHDCTFVVRVGETEFRSRVAAMVGTGYSCPRSPRPDDDWAVLRLETPIAGVEPYRPLPETVPIRAGDRVMSVANGSLDFFLKDPVTGNRSFPKTIGRCVVKKVYGLREAQSYFSSDCDGAQGASGGSVLDWRSGEPLLMGIYVKNQETPQQLKRAIARGIPNRGAYHELRWASYHVPLRGRFLRTLRRAVAEP